jgi:hypothetical protein
MNIAELILWQSRSKPSELALVVPGSPLNLVSYARLATMVSNVSSRLAAANVRIGDRVDLRVSEPLLRAIFAIALVRVGATVLSSFNDDYAWPFEITAVLCTSPTRTPSGKHILVGYDWLGEFPGTSEQRDYRGEQSNKLCCIFAEQDVFSPDSAVCIALTHELLDARIGFQELFMGASISSAARLFAAGDNTTSLGFQLLFSTLSRGGALFLMGDQTMSFNALQTYQVESAVVTPKELLDLTTFYDSNPDSECSLNDIFVAGCMSKSVVERASRTLGAKISLGYYLPQLGLIAAMPSRLAEGTDGAVGILLPGVAADAVGDDGAQLEVGKVGKLRFRSELSAQIYNAHQSSDGADDYIQTNQKGRLTQNRILIFQK